MIDPHVGQPTNTTLALPLFLTHQTQANTHTTPKDSRGFRPSSNGPDFKKAHKPRPSKHLYIPPPSALSLAASGIFIYRFAEEKIIIMSISILSMKMLLISAGVVSLAVGIKSSVPFAVNDFLVIWSVVLSWLKPPYLYIIINAMILVIVASSRFHHSQSEPSVQQLISVKTPPPSYYESSLSAQPEISAVLEESTVAIAADDDVVYKSEDRAVEVKAVIVNGSKVVIETEEEEVAEAEDVIVDSMVTQKSPSQEITSPDLQWESLLPVREKPLLSSRFGHRKPIRTNPEGGVRALKVARSKRQETLESTWKMITEGRHVPLTRHLKKSDTWEQHIDQFPKSETSNSDSPPATASARIRKEPSPSQDELNRQVEAFIKKINDEMRLQRQESLDQYKQMIKRGL